MADFILNRSNLIDYFKANVIPNISFQIDKNLQITFNEIRDFTNVNYLFRVVFKRENGDTTSVVLKHAQSFVKVKPEMPFDAKRNYYEAKTLTRYSEIWGKGVVPEVYYHDDKHNVNVLQDFGKDCLVLVDEFNRSRVHPEVGNVLGKRLGLLHSRTLGTQEIVRDTPAEEKNFKEYYLNFKMAGSKKTDEKSTLELINMGDNAKSSLIWGDPVTKNILFSENGVHFVDFEGALRWDPAFDLGHIVAHWILAYLENPKVKSDVAKFINNIHEAYKKVMLKKISRRELQENIMRSNKFSGATILHRLRGLSRFEIPEEKTEKINNVGVKMLRMGENSFLNLAK